MKQFNEMKKKLSLFLLIGILILCVGFIFINCGKGPQSKIINSDSGQFAVDFSQAPSGHGGIVYVVSNELLNRQGTEVTVEAWVKRNTANLTGGVFSRHESEGPVMWVKDNEPKFAIRRVVGPTSTDFVVESNVSLAANTWHHLAGVLVNAAHSHPSSSSCSPAVMAETPHMDIYVDGQFKNCASTGSRSMTVLTCTPQELGTGTCAGDTLAVGGFVAIDGVFDDGAAKTINTTQALNGVIDDVRYWTAARTQTQIQACMNQELVSHKSGDCGIENSNLGAYLKFNEGSGAAPSDWTGLGSGSKEDNGVPADSPARPWDGGWVSGAPITGED